MADLDTPIDRRRVLMLGAASMAGGAIASWSGRALAAADPYSRVAPVVDKPKFDFSQMSQLFRDHPRKLSFWQHYLDHVEEYRGGPNPDFRHINFQRWFYESKLSLVVRTVPDTPEDQKIKEYAHRLVLALLADFPGVPIRPDVAKSLQKCCAWYEAGGIDFRDHEAIKTCELYDRLSRAAV